MFIEISTDGRLDVSWDSLHVYVPLSVVVNTSSENIPLLVLGMDELRVNLISGVFFNLNHHWTQLYDFGVFP